MHPKPPTMLFARRKDVAPTFTDGELVTIGDLSIDTSPQVWFCSNCGRVRVALDFRRAEKSLELGLRRDPETGEFDPVEYSKVPHPLPAKWDAVEVQGGEAGGHKKLYAVMVSLLYWSSECHQERHGLNRGGVTW